MPYLEIGYEQFGSETRRLTVMFASLGVDLSSAQTATGMAKIQQIVTTVQQQVYRLEGSLNKLVMDDKGSTLICIWGLCPFAHEDDAARAILTAFNIRRELLKIDGTYCNVGISTGEVFSGVVGTSGSRKEFSVLGDYVNLAARIMYQPKKYKQTGKVFVDLQTKKEADSYIKFHYHAHCEFKGKSISLPIYEPIDPDEETLECLRKVVNYDVFLKIQSNPFLVDRLGEHKKKFVKQVGRDTLLSSICNDLMDFFEPDHFHDGSSTIPYVAAILGESGSGKSLFGRCIYENLKKKRDFLRDQSGSEYKAILTSSLNAESQMRFLAIWRPVLQMMMTIHSKKNQISPEQILKRLFKKTREDINDIIIQLFNLHELRQSGKFSKLPLLPDPIWFVKREKYSDEHIGLILDFVIDFIKEVLGERNDDSSESISNASRVKSNFSQGSQLETPVLIIFDTVQLMDEASWRLLELVREECQRIAFILLIQTDSNNRIKVHPEAQQFFNESFQASLEQIRVIDLPPLKVEEFNHLIQELAPKYQAMMTEEIHLMTKIDDPAHSIKNPQVCVEKGRELRKKLFCNNPFMQISNDVLKLAVQRCEGNVLLTLSFLFNLLSNGFLEQKDQILFPSAVYLKCVKKNDWTTVPVPSLCLKLNCCFIDTFIKDMRAKQSKSEQDLAVKGILILKCAAVIGEVFSSRVLQSICPLRHETHKQIISVLRALEEKDYIEILDETDPKNATCRFRKCFFRETIYQVMLYRVQKKGLHQLFATFIQENPNEIASDPETEADIYYYYKLY